MERPSDTGHDFTALPAEWEAMKAFWDAHPRGQERGALAVERAVARCGRCDWVEILETTAAAKGAEGLTAKLLPIPAVTEARPRLGVTLDAEYGGPGVRIKEVEDGSAAANADVRPGDVLVEARPSARRRTRAILRAVLDTLTSKTATACSCSSATASASK
ncbi:MAG: hypothetical protein R3F05_00145 [Planctomycetota bacterium]